MRLFQITIFFILFTGLCFYACKNDADAGTREKRAQDSLISAGQSPILALSDKKGIVGIIDFPELLSLCKLDSAPAKDVASVMSHDFSELNRDLAETGAEMNGPQGLVYYNNDPHNFKFECLLLIRSMPKKAPTHSKVVALEADKMLVYNYYGSYETAFKAYAEIRSYCVSKGLEQSGPMREFYPAAATAKDSSRKLTRILVPVSLIGEGVSK